MITAAAGVGEVMEDNNEETSQQGSEAKDWHVEATAFGFQNPGDFPGDSIRRAEHVTGGKAETADKG